jgi:hypothetical protein
MNYNTEQVIQLVEEWQNYVMAHRLEHKYDDNFNDYYLFSDWLINNLGTK